MNKVIIILLLVLSTACVSVQMYLWYQYDPFVDSYKIADRHYNIKDKTTYLSMTFDNDINIENLDIFVNGVYIIPRYGGYRDEYFYDCFSYRVLLRCAKVSGELTYAGETYKFSYNPDEQGETDSLFLSFYRIDDNAYALYFSGKKPRKTYM